MKILKFVLITSVCLIYGCSTDNEENNMDLSTIEQEYINELEDFFNDDAVVDYIPEESKFEILITNVEHVLYLEDFGEFDIDNPTSNEASTYVGTINRMMLKYSEEMGDPYTIAILDPSDYEENIYVYKSGHQTYSRPF